MSSHGLHWACIFGPPAWVKPIPTWVAWHGMPVHPGFCCLIHFWGLMKFKKMSLSTPWHSLLTRLFPCLGSVWDVIIAFLPFFPFSIWRGSTKDYEAATASTDVETNLGFSSILPYKGCTSKLRGCTIGWVYVPCIYSHSRWELPSRRTTDSFPALLLSLATSHSSANY